MTLEAVQPVRPVAPYLGGKRILSKRLVEIIGKIPHRSYAEPFVGMGGVFFRRTARPKKEVINDINMDVVLLFRWLQRHYQQVLDVLKWQICSRAEFLRLVDADVAKLTELERVARFLYLQRTSYGGKVVSQAYGITRDNPARFDLTKLVPMLEDVHERLCGVDIECLPYAAFIETYDTADTLFYLDPPYFGNERDYGPGVFSADDFDRLRGLLETIKGRFILSINDHPKVREIFAGLQMEEVGLNYRISGNVTPAKELIISNGVL
ncbi:MAG: DNA adenine methylase [Sphingorhabdus sp.]